MLSILIACLFAMAMIVRLRIQKLGHGSFHLTPVVVSKAQASFSSDFGKGCHYFVLVEIYGFLLGFNTVLLLKYELSIIYDVEVLIFVVHLGVYDVTIVYFLNFEE
jgi:hypothetical protein